MMMIKTDITNILYFINSLWLFHNHSDTMDFQQASKKVETKKSRGNLSAYFFLD